MSSLRNRVLVAMRLRGMSSRTVESYIHAMEALARFHWKPLDTLSCDDVQSFLDELIRVRKLAWATLNVYPKPVPASPAKALEYVARYTHKVAIGDHRIVDVSDGRVAFKWRDRADGNTVKQCRLPAAEFTRRFLNHILPKGFQHIRYYGWMAAAQRTENLEAIRQALGVQPPEPDDEEGDLADKILARTGVDIRRCPHCGRGRLQPSERIIPAERAPP